jgi:4-aminobutyrate aminotransferase-like enzyme
MNVKTSFASARDNEGKSAAHRGRQARFRVSIVENPKEQTRSVAVIIVASAQGSGGIIATTIPADLTLDKY